MPNKCSRRAAQRGMVLLEVVIAFAILGLSVSVILSTASTAFRATRIADNRLLAATFAESMLAEISTELEAGRAATHSGRAGPFHWHIVVKPLSSTRATSVERNGAVPVTVVVTVSWVDHGTAREITLESVRMGRGDIS